MKPIKILIIIFLMATFSGCSKYSEHVAGDVKGMLQEKFKIDPRFSDSKLDVTNVSLIMSGITTFEGIATVNVDGVEHNLPITVHSDLNSTMYQINPLALLSLGPTALGMGSVVAENSAENTKSQPSSVTPKWAVSAEVDEMTGKEKRKVGYRETVGKRTIGLDVDCEKLTVTVWDGNLMHKSMRYRNIIGQEAEKEIANTRIKIDDHDLATLPLERSDQFCCTYYSGNWKSNDALGNSGKLELEFDDGGKHIVPWTEELTKFLKTCPNLKDEKLLATERALSVENRLGTVQGDIGVKDRLLSLNGNAIDPNIEVKEFWDVSVERGFKLPYEDGNAFLLQFVHNIIGERCRTKFRWLIVTPKEIRQSPEFGACLFENTPPFVNGGSLIVTLQDSDSRGVSYTYNGDTIVKQ